MRGSRAAPDSWPESDTLTREAAASSGSESRGVHHLGGGSERPPSASDERNLHVGSSSMQPRASPPAALPLSSRSARCRARFPPAVCLGRAPAASTITLADGATDRESDGTTTATPRAISSRQSSVAGLACTDTVPSPPKLPGAPLAPWLPARQSKPGFPVRPRAGRRWRR